MAFTQAGAETHIPQEQAIDIVIRFTKRILERH
jgi:hypothetical protein